MLWLQVGSSYPYEIALGAVELAAGVLLFWPRTATLGALLALASMAEVFVMNMTFDVSVKILSFQLLLLSLVLLAPHANDWRICLSCNGSSPPVTQPALFTSARANKVATAVQVAVGAWVLLGSLAHQLARLARGRWWATQTRALRHLDSHRVHPRRHFAAAADHPATTVGNGSSSTILTG